MNSLVRFNIRFASLAIAALVSIVGLEQAHGLGIPAPFGVARDPSPLPSSSASTGTNSGVPSGSTPSTPSTNSGGSTSTSTFKALWTGSNANAPQWTIYAQDAVAKYGADLIKGSNDVSTFCPMYDRLGTQDRVNFWVQLIAAMSKYESGFNPASRMIETTMSVDPVTGKQTASEGLLQLSYSDENNYDSVLPDGVCDFDYTKDKAYSVTDVRRTILDPKTNLTCGIAILNRQVQRDHLVAESTRAYWAVIKTDRSTNKLSEIRAITKALAFCN